MSGFTIALRGLQVYCVISALIAFAGGGTYLVSGADGLATLISHQVPAAAQSLKDAVASLGGADRVAFDMGLRSLAWYWVMAGGMLLWITPNVTRHTAWFRAIHVGFMAVGVATVIGMLEHGDTSRAFALVPEFGIPLVAMVWQGWLAGQPGASAD